MFCKFISVIICFCFSLISLASRARHPVESSSFLTTAASPCNSRSRPLVPGGQMEESSDPTVSALDTRRSAMTPGRQHVLALVAQH